MQGADDAAKRAHKNIAELMFADGETERQEEARVILIEKMSPWCVFCEGEKFQKL